MVVLLIYIIGTTRKLKFDFSLSDSTQFDFYQHQSEENVGYLLNLGAHAQRGL